MILIYYIQQYMELSREAIIHMLAIQQADQEEFRVEVSNITQKKKGQYLSFQLSDGDNICKGYIEVDQPEKNLLTFMKPGIKILNILIKAHVTHNYEPKIFIIQILQFDILSLQTKIKKVKKESESFVPFLKQEYVQLSTEKKFKSIKYQGQDCSTPKHVKLQPRKTVNNNRATDQSQEETRPYQLNEFDIKGFQKISDLYESFYGWEILVRVIDQQYRDFISKAGKPTKILTVQLIDKAGDIIQAIFFNQLAEAYNLRLQNGRIFRMSRGSIKQNKLQSNKGQKYSKYSIVFGRDSSIVEVQNVVSIPLCSNNWTRLSQVLSNFNSLQQYNIIAIVLSVQPEKCILKENRELVMQSMQVGDPITYNYIKVVVWNKQVTVDLAQFMDKSVLLKHFKVSRYKEELHLNSTFKSDIVLHQFFKNEEGKFKVTFNSNALSIQGKFKTLKKLNEQLLHIGENPIYSNLILWICSINVESKWYYDACTNPFCRKSAISYSKCPHCFVEIEECCRKFLLSVQFCDSTGGLWVTVFDEIAKDLLNGATIEKLLQLEKNSQLKQFVEKRMYDSFRVLVCSKKDSTGRIKHHLAGKVIALMTKQAIIDNLQRIKSVLDASSH